MFGPETPPGNFRPRDADATGGYYQPVRVDVDGLLALGLSRITCKLATAPSAVAHEYDVSYVANQNPTLYPPVLTSVAPSADVMLTASWSADSAEATSTTIRCRNTRDTSRGHVAVMVATGGHARRRCQNC
ncbi:MAG TPA: hypothetical protein VHN14_32215 [Kofleriaceae bacterium]|nr:hypothetical protein [Kofleriaceae bacterium]